jgi:hypothetical protein
MLMRKLSGAELIRVLCEGLFNFYIHTEACFMEIANPKL